MSTLQWGLSARAASLSMALVLVTLVYTVLALSRPADVFWSSDQGGKMLQVMALLAGRYDLSISYPGAQLDPELEFRPYVHAYVVDGTIQVPWPMTWALPSALLYAGLGAPGLLVLPMIGGLLGAWGAGRLAERILPGTGWLAVLLTGLATPMLVYSSLFWEHAPAAGLFAAGLALMPLDRVTGGRQRALVAGLCFGVAIAWRNETILYLVAAGLAAFPVLARERRLQHLVWLGAGLCIAALPIAVYKLLLPGAAGARTDLMADSWEQVFQNLLTHLPTLPADFLSGRPEFGPPVPALLRWAPPLGVLLLGMALMFSARWRRGLRLIGLLLVGSATMALLVPPHTGVIRGFLLAAPFVALVLLAPCALFATRTGKALSLFAALAMSLYAIATAAMFTRGYAFGGLEWGPRYLLHVYPPVAVLAAVALYRIAQERLRLELGLGAALVALGLGCQLVGLAEIEQTHRQNRVFGELIASLPPGPVVLGPRHLAQKSPGLAHDRPVFCTETPAALKRWSELALRAGEQELWFVDQGPLPDAWLMRGATPPSSLTELRAGSFRAVRYGTASVQAALRGDGPERIKCGYNREYIGV